MNVWATVYVLAGLGTLAAIVATIGADLEDLFSPLGVDRPRIVYAATLAVLVSAWLVAAVLR